MPYIGIAKREGTCPICSEKFQAGVLVYFDSTKSQGNHMAHRVCYDDLRASRDEQPPLGKEVKSHEELDPPF